MCSIVSATGKHRGTVGFTVCSCIARATAGGAPAQRNLQERSMSAVVEIIQPGVKTAEGEETPPVVLGRAVYEHPFIVRLCHWINTVALCVMVGSGLQIFRAFPSFGAKIPQKDLLDWPKAFAIGGWLGGALQWHLTFMWIYIATGVVYLAYQLFSGNYRQVLFTHRDIPGVWPMV